MINLRADCLAFKNSEGESTPASVDHIALEMAASTSADLDETILKNAACAVLHYFKADLKQEIVSAVEFAKALESALRGLGFDIKAETVKPVPPRIAEADLRCVAGEREDGLELIFFPRLRDELRRQLGQEPQVMRFYGLRDCVKSLVGARRWSLRCQRVNDQIVEFLRTCLGAEKDAGSCALLVQ